MWAYKFAKIVKYVINRAQKKEHRMLFYSVHPMYNCFLDDIGCTKSKQCPMFQIPGRAHEILTSVVQLERVELAPRGLGAHVSVHNLGAELVQGDRVVQWFTMDKRQRITVNS